MRVRSAWRASSRSIATGPINPAGQSTGSRSRTGSTTLSIGSRKRTGITLGTMLLRIGCLTRFNYPCRTLMPYFRDRSPVFWSFAFLILLSGCGAEPECDSTETRNAVLQIVSDDRRNPLETYAAKNSNVAKEKSSAAKLENAKPLYLLGEKIVTTSTSKDKRTLTCSGGISVSVGDMKASKEVNFTVQQKSDGKLSVSVAPFEF